MCQIDYVRNSKPHNVLKAFKMCEGSDISIASTQEVHTGSRGCSVALQRRRASKQTECILSGVPGYWLPCPSRQATATPVDWTPTRQEVGQSEGQAPSKHSTQGLLTAKQHRG